jgi:hypothetical protein
MDLAIQYQATNTQMVLRKMAVGFSKDHTGLMYRWESKQGNNKRLPLDLEGDQTLE